jgi:hypothetical protein
MARRWQARISFSEAGLLFLLCAGSMTLAAQQVDRNSLLQKVDAAVKARFDGIAGYTATEHYAVFRNKDEVHPVAEMTVKATYKRDSGKTYVVVSETGSTVIRKLVLHAILDNEEHINLPSVREGAWLTTSNYWMKMKGGAKVGGQDCVALELTPRRKDPYLLDGTLWVNGIDGKIVQIEGKAAKNASVFTGPTQMMRQYANVEGFAQATRARAQSNSFLFGLTVVTIDYLDYHLQLRPRP